MSASHQPIRRVRRLLRLGRFIAALIGVVAIMVVLWLCFGLADAFAAFETPARTGITGGLVTAACVIFLVSTIRAFRISTHQAADAADTALADSRRPVSAALSLDPDSASSPFTKMLTQRTLDSVNSSLAALPSHHIIPWQKARLALLVLAAPLLVIGFLQLTVPNAFSTVASRLLHPSSDIPPYSPLRFKIDPAKPVTVYGGEILLGAEITGATLTKPVECLVRNSRGGPILRLPAFRESPTRFSRKFDGLTEPVEIAFASGKARSVWHPVEILLEPNISSGLVRLTPPAYTGLPSTSFTLDTNEIAAIEGSTVTLELTSNRPLSYGLLTFTPVTLPGNPALIESHPATIPATHVAAFTWIATRTGRLAATVRDLRGTPSPKPLELAFRALPDQPPAVDLSAPPRMLLATPRSVIPVEARASDDFSLSRLQFVRTLAGFRDRVRLVAPSLREKAYDFTDKLDLQSLGLEAGQTLELMLEASDHNPSLLGHGSSEISRIRIISEDQYAEYLRNKTTIGEFSARFIAVHRAVEKARQALEELRAAPTPETLEKARAAHREAAELLGKIADDFPAFDLEKRLQDLARKQAADLRLNLTDLQKSPEPPDANAIEAMLERLGQRDEQAKEIAQDADLIRQAASLLEMAAKFRQIYDTQTSLAKRFGTILDEIRHGQDQNRRLLPSLGETQERNRVALMDFKTELRRRAEAFREHPQLADFAESALEFISELDVAAPESLMAAATAHGNAGKAVDAFTNSELARALLERLLSEPKPFPQACQGTAPSFNIPRPDANSTIAQMLAALMCQNPGTTPNDGIGGGGMGAGGFGPSGSAMAGFSVDLPVVGPDRLQFDPIAGLASGGDGKGTVKPVKPLPTTAEEGSLKPTGTRQGESSSTSPESIPEPYRDAVKRYFTP